ncbi:MAG: hypothetical protein QOF96_3643, partial [Actinomycetota bacterium]|nr:hypothetical protein [Actinomycetota bacterium]
EGALNRLADTGLTDPDALRRAASERATLVESAS